MINSLNKNVNGLDECNKLIALVCKPECEQISSNLLKNKVFSESHLEVIKEIIHIKALLTFALEKLPSLIKFMNERDLTLEKVLSIYGYDFGEFDAFMEYIGQLTSELLGTSTKEFQGNLEKAEADLFDKGIYVKFTKVLHQSILFGDKYISDILNHLESTVKEFTLSPSELKLYLNFYESFSVSKEDFISSIKKYGITSEQAASLDNAAIKNNIKSLSDFESVLKLLNSTTNYVDPYKLNRVFDVAVKKFGIDKALEVFLKYDLSENQVNILHTKLVIGTIHANHRNDFEDIVKTVSSLNLDEGQIKLLNHYKLESILKNHVSKFDAVMKVISSYYLDENQFKVFTSSAVKQEMLNHEKNNSASDLDAAMKAISSHHLTDDQIIKLVEDLDSRPTLKNPSELDYWLTNIEKHNQHSKPWGAYLWDTLGYGEKAQTVAASTPIKPQTNGSIENNIELVPPIEGHE